VAHTIVYNLFIPESGASILPNVIAIRTSIYSFVWKLSMREQGNPRYRVELKKTCCCAESDIPRLNTTFTAHLGFSPLRPAGPVLTPELCFNPRKPPLTQRLKQGSSVSTDIVPKQTFLQVLLLWDQVEAINLLTFYFSVLS
jgi:hypothetical protein